MEPLRPPSRGHSDARRAPAACTIILFAATVLGGCAHSGVIDPGTMRCDAGLRPAAVERLYFGTQRPGGVVSVAEWDAFVGDTVAARFPAGFTTWDAAGGWRGADGHALREPSHVLEVMHPVGAAANAAIETTIADYKARFDQEAVLRVRVPACVAP